jgi:Zn-dependent protease with chaperone function
VGTNEHLEGTTLYASLSLMRILGDAEFDAVIGHELGHFRGADTAYSLKFAPTYARLSQALHVLSDGAGNASDLGRIPALAALAAYLTRFATSERTVGRERELLADQAGASASNKEALATALLKVALFSGNWDWLTRQHIAELNEGRTFTALSTTFNEVSRLPDDADWHQIRDSVASAIQAHPIDTHPTFIERLQGLGLSPADLEAADCDVPSVAVVTLLENAEELDASLSGLEAKWLLAIGAAQLPQSHE